MKNVHHKFWEPEVTWLEVLFSLITNQNFTVIQDYKKKKDKSHLSSWIFIFFKQFLLKKLLFCQSSNQIIVAALVQTADLHFEANMDEKF